MDSIISDPVHKAEYKLIKKLGEGAFGVVYLAVKLNVDKEEKEKKYALKFIKDTIKNAELKFFKVGNNVMIMNENIVRIESMFPISKDA